VTRVAGGNPFALHTGACETWAFIEQKVLEGGLVDRALKDICFAYVADPDAVDVESHEGRERAALDWAYAIVWDADAAGDELWHRLHEHFNEPELVELGCAIGFELGRQHFLRTLGADPGACRAYDRRSRA
jgi:alkylhydroperoxidase family enzyme